MTPHLLFRPEIPEKRSIDANASVTGPLGSVLFRSCEDETRLMWGNTRWVGTLHAGMIDLLICFKWDLGWFMGFVCFGCTDLV